MGSVVPAERRKDPQPLCRGVTVGGPRRGGTAETDGSWRSRSRIPTLPHRFHSPGYRQAGVTGEHQGWWPLSPDCAGTVWTGSLRALGWVNEIRDSWCTRQGLSRRQRIPPPPGSSGRGGAYQPTRDCVSFSFVLWTPGSSLPGSGAGPSGRGPVRGGPRIRGGWGWGGLVTLAKRVGAAPLVDRSLQAAR